MIRMNLTIDKERFITIFHACGIEELEVIVPILKERIDHMLKGVIELIEMLESDDFLPKPMKALEFWYETKKRIENLK